MKAFIFKYTILGFLIYFGLLYMWYKIPVEQIFSNSVNYIQSWNIKEDINKTKEKIDSFRQTANETKEIVNKTITWIDSTIKTINKTTNNINSIIKTIKQENLKDSNIKSTQLEIIKNKEEKFENNKIWNINDLEKELK